MARRCCLLVVSVLLLDAGALLAQDGPLPEFAIARLGSMRFRWNLGFGSGLASIFFSPDGKTVGATCDKGLALWDADSGNYVPWFEPNASIRAAAFTPDGKKLITWGQSARKRDFRKQFRTLEHWQVGVGKRLLESEHDLTLSIGSTDFARFSADGKLLMHIDGGEVVIRETLIGAVKAKIPEKVDSWLHADISQNGKTLALIRRDVHEGRLGVYDLPEGKLRHVLFREGEIQYAPTLSPDGKLLVASGRESLFVWDPVAGKLLREVPNARGRIAFSSDGKQLACATSSGIQLFSLPDCTLIRRIDEMRDYVYAVAFSPDGKRLATGHDQAVVLWDVATGKQTAPPDGHQASVCSLAFSADGKTLAAGSAEGIACIWDVATRKEKLRVSGHFGAVASVAISPDGKTLATGDGAAQYQTGGGQTHLRFWDSGIGKLLRKVPAHINGTTCLDFAPDGKTILTGGLDARVRLWNVADGARLGQVRGGDSFHWGQFTRDGKTILVVDGSGGASLWNSDMSKKVHDLPSADRHFELAALSSDGKHVIAATSGRGRGLPISLDRWECATGKMIASENLGVKSLAVRRSALSPDGRMIATVSSSVGGNVEFWDTQTRALIGRLPSYTWYVNSMAFSPAGSVLAAGGMDSSLMLWDVGKATKKGN